MSKVTVIGSGSWGVALATYLAKQGNEVKVWSFSEDEKNLINNERKCVFLPKITLPENIYCTTSYEEALEGSKYIIHVTPSKFVRNTIKGYKEFVTEEQVILMCSKGFEAGTNLALDDVIEEELPGQKYGILAGPSHAEEVSIDIPTALVIASHDEEVREEVAELFKSPVMRIYKSKDVKGVELGGALKNIVAIAAGVCGGLGLGDNTRAALITRGMTEMARLGVCMGAKGHTFTGLTGVGDLIVTCMSDHSRNNRFGRKLGQGISVKDALDQVGTVEGYYAAEMAHNLSIKYGIELPIISACYEVMYEGKDIKQALFDLMERPGRSEH